MKDWVITYHFALPIWPALIRNRMPFFGIAGAYWIYWGKYTRVKYWHKRLGRYRTYDSYLGWQSSKELHEKLELQGLPN